MEFHRHETHGEDDGFGVRALETLTPAGMMFLSSSQRTLQAGLCRRGGDQLHDDLVGSRAACRSRQLPVMNENRRCSILFRLQGRQAAGGTMVIGTPRSSASFCNSSFHRRTREPLPPPPSAATSRLPAFG